MPLVLGSWRVSYHLKAQCAPTVSLLPSREKVGMGKAALSEEANSFWVGSGDFSS